MMQTSLINFVYGDSCMGTSSVTLDEMLQRWQQGHHHSYFAAVNQPPSWNATSLNLICSSQKTAG
jgi:hypothetical protein